LAQPAKYQSGRRGHAYASKQDTIRTFDQLVAGKGDGPLGWIRPRVSMTDKPLTTLNVPVKPVA
jgi:hypothetical protein